MSRYIIGARREEVLDLLHDDPRSIAELAEEIGVHYETVRGHIRALMEAGVVEIFSRLSNGNRGRRTIVYQLARTKRRGG